MKEEYFEQDDRRGGPVNPLHGFEKLISTYFKNIPNMKAHPMFKYLEHFSRLSEVELTNQDDVYYTPEETNPLSEGKVKKA